MARTWLRGLVAGAAAAGLALGALAPSAAAGGSSKGDPAGKSGVWVSGDGIADLTGETCTDFDSPASIFTSDLGPDLGLNGCWYFRDFGEETVTDLGDGYFQTRSMLEETFVGTLHGEPITFDTKNAVVVGFWVGDPSDPSEEAEQVSGGCLHPLERPGRGAIVLIEDVEAEVPTVRFYGHIAVKNKRR